MLETERGDAGVGRAIKRGRTYWKRRNWSLKKGECALQVHFARTAHTPSAPAAALGLDLATALRDVNPAGPRHGHKRSGVPKFAPKLLESVLGPGTHLYVGTHGKRERARLHIYEKQRGGQARHTGSPRGLPRGSGHVTRADGQRRCRPPIDVPAGAVAMREGGDAGAYY